LSIDRLFSFNLKRLKQHRFKLPNCCPKIAIAMVHPEIDDAATFLAGKAVPEVAAIIDTKTIHMIIMYRA